jgi:hypothetical protein
MTCVSNNPYHAVTCTTNFNSDLVNDTGASMSGDNLLIHVAVQVSTGSVTDTLLTVLDACLWGQFNKLQEHTKKKRRKENLFNMTL